MNLMVRHVPKYMALIDFGVTYMKKTKKAVSSESTFRMQAPLEFVMINVMSRSTRRANYLSSTAIWMSFTIAEQLLYVSFL